MSILGDPVEPHKRCGLTSHVDVGMEIGRQNLTWLQAR
jgi:hypothetical protein